MLFDSKADDTFYGLNTDHNGPVVESIVSLFVQKQGKEGERHKLATLKANQGLRRWSL